MILKPAPLRLRSVLAPLFTVLASGAVHANPVLIPYDPLPEDHGLHQAWFILLAMVVEYVVLRVALKPTRPNRLFAIVVGVHLVSYPITVALAFWSVMVAEIAALGIEYLLYRWVARRFAKPPDMGWRTRDRLYLFNSVLAANLLSFLAGLTVLWWLHGPSRQEMANVASLSHTKSSMWSMTTAINSYKVDHNVYPQNLSALTTPIAYILEIPGDPFSPYSSNEHSEPLRYLVTRDTWLVWSAGPDRNYDLTTQNLPDLLRRISADTSHTLEILSPFTYDPTNAANSKGDVWKTKPLRQPEDYRIRLPRPSRNSAPSPPSRPMP